MAHNVHHFTLATNLSKLSSVFFQINTSQNQPWKLLIRSTSANLHGCFTNTRVSRDNSVLSKSNQPTNQAHCSIQRPNIPHKPVAEMHTQNHAQERVTKSCPHLHTLFHWQGISLSLTHTHTRTTQHATEMAAGNHAFWAIYTPFYCRRRLLFLRNTLCTLFPDIFATFPLCSRMKLTKTTALLTQGFEIHLLTHFE